MKRILLNSCLATIVATSAMADERILGDETLYQSPNGITERCVQLARMPGAVYSDADLAREAAFCAVDLHAATTGLCPKTWSTSPALMIYDLSGGPFAGDRTGFAAAACPQGKDAKHESAGEIARLKPSMNDPRTSGTYSPSPLLYYHLSRYLGSDIGVPPAVWRSMDRQVHLAEVAQPGVDIAAAREASDQLQAAWEIFLAADVTPESYVPTDDVFTADRTAVYGTMILNVGDDYGPEINGASDADWGVEVYHAFQQTAPYLALRSDKPLPEAVAEGVNAALANPAIAEAMGTSPDPRQIVVWMADVANIALLDYLLNQQDRYGNIDYVESWYWVEDGQLMSRLADDVDTATETLPDGAVLLRRTHINDNDAGLRPEFQNFARESGMLDDLRHFPADTYRQLMQLDADLRAGGPLHAYLQTTFGMGDAAFATLVANTAAAAETLRAQCHAGTMQFDLDPEAFILAGTVEPAQLDCDAP